MLLIAAVCSPEQMRAEVLGNESVSGVRTPTDFVLIIDKSGSMGSGNRFSEVQRAASRFVKGLKGEDRVGVIGVDSQTHIYSDLTWDTQHLLCSIERMTIGDWTHYTQGIFDARTLFDERTSWPCRSSLKRWQL